MGYFTFLLFIYCYAHWQVKEKKWQACKPGSVILTSSENACQHPLSFILPRHHCRSPAAYPSWLPCALETRRAALMYRDSGKQSGYTWLCNPWDVRLMMLPPPPVRFYRTFSPLPGLDTSKPGGYFLLRCYPLSKIFPLRSTAPCVARTFLIPSNRDTIKRPAVAKIKNSSGFKVQSLIFQSNTLNFAQIPNSIL